MVPSVVHQELTSRRMAEARELLKDHILAAVEVLVEVATDRDAPADHRARAAGMILDRTLGRAPINVVLESEPPWAQAIQHATIGVVSANAGVIETTAMDAAPSA